MLDICVGSFGFVYVRRGISIRVGLDDRVSVRRFGFFFDVFSVLGFSWMSRLVRFLISYLYRCSLVV